MLGPLRTLGDDNSVRRADYGSKTSWNLPQFPVALSLSRGGADARGALPSGGGGFPIMVTLSHEGSISESASRSQED